MVWRQGRAVKRETVAHMARESGEERLRWFGGKGER